MKYQYRGKFDPEKLPIDCIDRLSTGMVPKNSKILELGAATGFMSEYFKHKLNCTVDAVEIDPKAAKLAMAHCRRVITGSLDEAATWDRIRTNQKYDVVFASAIIEHLKNPDTILNSIKEVLKPDGILIITVPNIAHWRMRLHLLLGKWEYQDYGVLDRTHLKFFTYYTFQELINQSGFKIDEVKIDPAGGIKYFNIIAKHFPNFYGHQIAIKATKR
jgi:methionine biosynthesis protein MetW